MKTFTTCLGFLLCWFLSSTGLFAQTSSVHVSVNMEEMSLQKFVTFLNDHYPLRCYVTPTDSSNILPSISFTDKPIELVLDSVLQKTNLGYLRYQSHVFIIAPRDEIKASYSADYYHALEEGLETAKVDDLEVVVGSIDEVDPTGQTTISGLVVDQGTEEPIIGATILVQDQDMGTATDEDGKYSLTLDPGSYVLSIQYIGYQGRNYPVRIISSGTLDLSLIKGSILLDEVVVQAKGRDENIQSVQIGTSKINIKELERLPSFLGEVDVIRGLLIQPGVTSVGEGSSGFNVRGGNIDQNLIMMDEGIIFNASHSLGFFSSFSADMVQDALLYKGNMPARYGGRLASVLDVNVRDGNFQKTRLKGGIGPISSRLTFETPLLENKTSLLISGRSSYSNWILQSINIPELKNSSAFFYDAMLRVTHRFNEKNFVSLAAYSTSDDFGYADQFGFNYQTVLTQFNYRSQIGNHLLSTLSGVWSDYKSAQLDLFGFDASELATGNSYYKLKENLNIAMGMFNLDVGASGIWYQVNPGVRNPMGEESVVLPRETDLEKGLEMAAYVSTEIEVNKRLSLQGGLRYSRFHFRGPQDMHTYLDPNRPEADGLQREVAFTQKVIHSEGRFEPRLSGRYKMSSTASIKFGYARTSQYINQLFNNETPTPTSLWQLTNQYVPSSLSHNFSLGYFKNYADNIWITSIEAYYRNIDRLFDYRDFADLVANSHVETEILSGRGRARGVELGIKRQVGTIHGSINYTYSRSERKVVGINKSGWYAASFDKPHDLTLIVNVEMNKRNQLAFNFTYSSGRPTTIPVDRHFIQGQIAVLNYSDRNAFRIPDYHRLDLAYTIGQGYRKSKKFKTSWTFSVYNLYGRRNAYSVFIEQSKGGRPDIKRLSILGNAFPSLTFNFELI
ncbi:MAG: TonB-dependent receptor [Saprospiraceae bacterium]|nr:TonB-dependent receptor [Saprospiraceae bacterium]